MSHEEFVMKTPLLSEVSHKPLISLSESDQTNETKETIPSSDVVDDQRLLGLQGLLVDTSFVYRDFYLKETQMLGFL